jgi:hypothetical protein
MLRFSLFHIEKRTRYGACQRSLVSAGKPHGEVAMDVVISCENCDPGIDDPIACLRVLGFVIFPAQEWPSDNR